MNDELKLLLEAFLIKSGSSFDLDSFLFDKQLAFIKDPEPFKVAVCSRRSGKTVACSADLTYQAISNEGVVCLYITLSRNNAKKIVWPEIQKINRAFKLGGVEDNTELSMRFPNGSIIYLSGAKDAAEIQKFRGLPIKLVYIDECQSFRQYIRDLIDDILAPALMDYAGSICLIGTPAPVPSGFFHECAVETDTWSKHGWNFFDNPYIAQKSGHTHQELLERELKRRGVSIDDPSIQREWFGKWSLDLDSLLLHYNSERNHFEELPRGHWNYLMGIDLGFVDADAIAILAWSETDPSTYLVEESVIPKQGISELVEQIEYLQKKYGVVKMVIDEGGLGKKIAEEIRRRHQVPVQPADKLRKMENIAFLNDALRTSRFKAKKTSRFAQDSFLVEIDRDKTTPDRIKVKDGYHSDICVAWNTWITTQNGFKRICIIKPGDLVLTRSGYKKVLANALTQENAETFRLTFSNGSMLTCTPSHKIFTNERGFIRAKDLIHSDTFSMDTVCQKEINQNSIQRAENGQNKKEKPRSLIHANFIDIRNQTNPIKETIFGAIGAILKLAFIRRFGSSSMEKFKKDDTSIIETETPSTTILPISNVSMPCHTSERIKKKDSKTHVKKKNSASIWRKFEGLPLDGIGAKKGEPGIECTQKISLTKREGGPKIDVFNITVEADHEYFANGILVKNCDAVLYAFKESPAHTYQAPIVKPKYLTPEWAKDEVTKMEKDAIDYFENLEKAENGFGDW